jgi:uncharacterized repeat protein (TIGR01451 family)
VINTNDAGPGSLRDAINQANGSPGGDLINFSIGMNTPTIAVGSLLAAPLPTITETVTIDGATGGAIRIELDGTMAGAAADGLTIAAANCNIRSLVINRFTGNGISISGAGGVNTIQNSFIGTDAAGTAMLNNAGSGVRIDSSPNNRIGGTTSGERNIISGNDASGVVISNSSTGNQIQGNFIGTDMTGSAPLGNAGAGVVLDSNSFNNTIGGTGAGAGNIISGNAGQGVVLSLASSNFIQGNLIGTDVTGLAPLPNSAGVRLLGGSGSNLIGGVAAGAGNTIAFNNGAGLNLFGGGQNAVLSNSIFSNTGIGIDLSDDAGVTANDPCDGDSGANGLQNFPDLMSAVSNGGNIHIQGSLNSIASSQFRVEFFSNSSCDPSGNGEGAVFIGSTMAATDPACIAPIDVTLPASVSPGQVITATATDLQNNTSEFSQCVTVAAAQADLAINKTAMPSPVPTGSNLTYTIGVINSGPSDAVGATVTDNVPAGTTFVSVTTSQGTFSAPPAGGTGMVTCSLGTIPVGGSATITLIVSVNAGPGSNISNTASVTATTSDPVAGNNSSNVLTPVISSPCTLNCPGDVTANTLDLPFGCGTQVSYPPPTPIGACAAVTCSPPSNSFFPVGVTSVICSDSGGVSCSFNVTVKDTTAPRITCSGNITVSAPIGQNSAVVSYSLPTVVDNCSGLTATCAPPSGSAFQLGISVVTCSATDGAGNGSSCSFLVTVNDSQAPTITCPSPVTVESLQCSVVVNYPPPTVADNTPGANVSCAPPSNSAFPRGTTTVNCVAVDQSGNRATCAFTVTVRQPPGGAAVNPDPVTFGSQTPVEAVRKAKKNPPASCDCSKTFTIQNAGCETLGLNLSSISRTGSDVSSGRITDPDDSKFFSLRIVNANGSEGPFPEACNQFCVQIPPGQSQVFRVVFSPVIPGPSGKTSGLSANQVLPNSFTSRITLNANSGGTISVDLIARVSTALQLINAARPKKAPTMSFTKSGNEFIVNYSVFDPNLDTNRAKYELFDERGELVGVPIEVDLVQPIIDGHVFKGQSFVVEQRLSGAASHPEIVSIRLTVFDPESDDSLTAGLNSSASAGGLKPNRAVGVTSLRTVIIKLDKTRE